MQTEMPFFEGPEDALREAVRAMGGPKRVGPMLWPDKSADAAARPVTREEEEDRTTAIIASASTTLAQALATLERLRDGGGNSGSGVRVVK